MIAIGYVSLPQVRDPNAAGYVDPATLVPSGPYDPSKTWASVASAFLAEMAGTGLVFDVVRAAAFAALATPRMDFDAQKTEEQTRAWYDPLVAANNGVTQADADKAIAQAKARGQHQALTVSLQLASDDLRELALDAELVALGFATTFLSAESLPQGSWTDGTGPLFPIVRVMPNGPRPPTVSPSEGRLSTMIAGNVSIQGTTAVGSGLAKVLFDREVQLRGITVSDPLAPPQEYVQRGAQALWATLAAREAQAKLRPIADRAQALAAVLVTYVQENAQVALDGWYADSTHGLDLGDGVTRYPVLGPTGALTLKVK